MRGNITRRGKTSWRIKFDVERIGGARQIRYVTFSGTKKEAGAELARLVHETNTGTFVDPAKLTVAEWLHKWLGVQHLSPRSVETYAVIIDRLTAVLGHIVLQKLRPVHVHDMALVKRDGSPVSASTARQAHRILKTALQAAVDVELVSRNVAAAAKAPAGEVAEVDILGPAEIRAVLEALKGSDLFPIVALALATGLRRGELLALRWQDIDLAGAELRVERCLERTKKAGYRFKTPKTKHSRRTISLPPSAVDALREHRVQQLELRIALGMGKLSPDALVFCGVDGRGWSPDHVSLRWRRTLASIPGMTKRRFHSLRHSHASALIAAGIDVVTVSRRLGHASPAITLNVYSHMFSKTDTTAAAAIEKVLKTT